MPMALLMAALCAGLTTAMICMALEGSALMAILLYVISGHLVMAAMLSKTALYRLR